ncbi:phage terminase large subunit [Chitinophaga sp. YIM B06452]|uniref:phage terminase large subunit n=1 Tax=Chitinophaga sp. YIM B06452 TaxID=3082158 RepID=UPI0031FF3140
MLNIYEVELARRNFLDYGSLMTPKWEDTWFHESYYKVLSLFAEGKIKKLMVFVPPQHGKSQGSTRLLPGYVLGKDPNRRIAVVSYSAPKARKFNREIQRLIDSPEYRQIFPETTLAGKMSVEAEGTWIRTLDEFEVVGKEGGVKTVGVGGPLTGDPVDMLILDDIYKDQKLAWSPTIRENIADWYDTVGDSRLHNDSQVLIVFTRWHEQDLAGRLLSLENDWHVVKYPALKVGPPTKEDPRKEGEPLWPSRHSKEKLEKSRRRNAHVFDSLYQQDPKPREGLLYKDLKQYRELPPEAREIKMVIDTADTGSDYLCGIVYSPTPSGYYVRDVIYTTEGMEVTEGQTATIVTKHQVAKTKIESNNGGRGFARNVERICRAMGNRRSAFEWYHQTNNKEVRIFTAAAEVQNMIYFPAGWDLMWPEFYSAVTGYLAKGKNANDDAPDTLTMIIEEEGNSEYLIHSG